MKLLLICTEKLPVPCIRGGAIQAYVDGILPYLRDFAQVTVYSVADPDLPDCEERAGIRYERFAAATPDAYYQAVYQRVGQGDFDWIIVYNRPSHVPRIGAAAPDARLLLSMHNEMFLPRKIDPGTASACLARTQRVITVSDFVADGIAMLYPEHAHKLQPVYSGVNLTTYTSRWEPAAAARRQKLLAEHGLTGKQVVLSVGRLSAKKGAHVLLDAMAEVRIHHPEAVLVVVGSKWYGTNEADSYVARLRQQAGALGDGVRFTGFLPPDRMPDCYLLGDIFVCGSQWQEPLARVHYEAMAAGLPIITTPRGGNPEVIEPGKNGLLVPEYDAPLAFARRIHTLLSQPEKAEKMGRYGRWLAEQKYGWARVASEIRQILEG